MSEFLGVDIGCGPGKREGYVGLDHIAFPGVDHVLDVTKDRWPFEDQSVDAIYSSHFFEHIDHHGVPMHHVFREMGRVAKEGGNVEIWIPYGWGEIGFYPSHVMQEVETFWLHLLVYWPMPWAEVFGCRVIAEEIRFHIITETADCLRSAGQDLEFAVKFYKGVVYEFGLFATIRRDMATFQPLPPMTYCIGGRGAAIVEMNWPHRVFPKDTK